MSVSVKYVFVCVRTYNKGDDDGMSTITEKSITISSIMKQFLPRIPSQDQALDPSSIKCVQGEKIK